VICGKVIWALSTHRVGLAGRLSCTRLCRWLGSTGTCTSTGTRTDGSGLLWGIGALRFTGWVNLSGALLDFKLRHPLRRQLDGTHHKNSSTNPPCVVLEGLSVVLERALYEQPQLAVVKVRNKGDSIAHWHFAPKQGEESPFKRWVSVNIKQGLLLPGEVSHLRSSLHSLTFYHCVPYSASCMHSTRKVICVRRNSHITINYPAFVANTSSFVYALCLLPLLSYLPPGARLLTLC
jgi:hypothetical protein